MSSALHHIPHRTKKLPPLRVGIGGPVGSGKTRLVESIVPLLQSGGVDTAVITNDLVTDEDARRVRASGVIDPQRVIAVETGACPHTAIREDPSVNLAAVDRLAAAYPSLDVVLIESGGDNLAATFSSDLVDFWVFVIDTAGGESRLFSYELKFIKARELARFFTTVVFAPEDLSLVRGDPGQRRDLLDQLVLHGNRALVEDGEGAPAGAVARDFIGRQPLAVDVAAEVGACVDVRIQVRDVEGVVGRQLALVQAQRIGFGRGLGGDVRARGLVLLAADQRGTDGHGQQENLGFADHFRWPPGR